MLGNPQRIEGGYVRAEHAELNRRLHPFVRFQGEIVSKGEAKRLAKIAENLARILSNQYISLRKEFAFELDDPRLIHLTWNVEAEKDTAVARRLHQLTGHKCEPLFRLGRTLANLSGLEKPDRLTIFRTSAVYPLRFHVDSEQSGNPNPDFKRTIVHLAGGSRELGFKTDDMQVDTTLRRGEAYTLHPDAIQHAANYKTESLALYVQGVC